MATVLTHDRDVQPMETWTDASSGSPVTNVENLLTQIGTRYLADLRLLHAAFERCSRAELDTLSGRLAATIERAEAAECARDLLAAEVASLRTRAETAEQKLEAAARYLRTLLDAPAEANEIRAALDGSPIVENYGT